MANKAISTLAVGSSVYLNVGGVRKEFLIVHQGKPSSMYDESCNGTWLLMKDCYEKRPLSTSYSNAYETSTVNTYLNGPFLGLFDSDIQGIIKQVKIPYHKGGGNGGTDQSGANGLSCKVFLLSPCELIAIGSLNGVKDGEKLDYFKNTGTTAAEERIAYLNGAKSMWLLRTPITNGNTYVATVAEDGSLSTAYVTNENGIRPALILPSDTLVDDSGNVVTVDLTAHKTLINGTAYTVKGGKCMVNGTVYNILKGRTLIGGTGYDITFAPDVSLTWYFNQTLSIPVSTTSTTFSTRAHYEGGSKTITGIQIINRGDNPNMSYLGSGFASTAWDQRRGWRDTAYRTITFDEAPSGDLLAWLQENATPQ